MRNLKSLRVKHDLNQNKIAQKLGISVVSYRNKENEHTQFTLKEAKKISEIFNTSIEEIFFKNEVYKKETNDQHSA
ncbi:helix-turn-helix transcriptional regulator [Marinisporobacter balticus]|uniref:DNA-binding XRE family transcriptional regulator n=1 Tax=Marinisporobacter balticus TaxID=2018667 RepID=A0A4R2L528_9FIRM|nr:helix-turn-helix domain-containing protein [Marinisporobacter balticus]TCO79099.1 DNA-binding XRE family transcriptional regulator [Marinisporobacter balticus]